MHKNVYPLFVINIFQREAKLSISYKADYITAHADCTEFISAVSPL